MWRDFNKISDVIQAASVWLLTLEKQGCSTMLQAGNVSHLSVFLSAFDSFVLLESVHIVLLYESFVFFCILQFITVYYPTFLLSFSLASLHPVTRSI